MFTKKNNLLKIIQKNSTQRKKVSMSIQAGQSFQNLHLVGQKIKLIFIEELIVLKSGVKK